MAQVPSGSVWAKNKHVLQDASVDEAMQKAQTSYLYKKLLEEKRKEWKPQEYKDPDHKTVNATTGLTRQKLQSEAINRRAEEDDFDSDLELEKELENDPELKKLQEKRLLEIKEAFKKEQQQRARGQGTYMQYDEKDLLKRAMSVDSMIIHFMADGYERCKILDEHFKRIAPKHPETMMVFCDAKKSPFLVAKWKIRTLPSICIVVDGYLVDKVIGFEELGGVDDFPTVALVRRLAKSGAIKDVDGKVKRKTDRTKTLSDVWV